jgi:hypothetical protein
MEQKTERLTYEDFKNRLNSQYIINTAEADVSIQLFELSEHKVSAQQERFSLLFKGPLGLFLPQKMYPCRHEEMGVFDLFIVPVAQVKDGFVYEAVFNRIIEHQ